MSPRYVVVACVLPIAVGAAAYILFRDTAMLWRGWFDAVGLMGAVMSARAWAAPLRASIPDWLLFSGPDGAWVFACTAFFARLWPDGPWWMRAFWIGLGAALALGGELGQVVGLVPGTFDLADLVAYLLAGGLGIWVARKWPRPLAS